MPDGEMRHQVAGHCILTY